MIVRSFDQLDLARSWARVLVWVRKAAMDVPDRISFELMERIWQGAPQLAPDHALQPTHLVLATKPAASTARPFVRLQPPDLLLYQALVDAVNPAIADALGGADEIFAYRLSPLSKDDPLDGSPSYGDFIRAVLAHADEFANEYLVKADVASFFISIDVNELELRLLEIGANALVVRDLRALLDNWHAEGICGLPQGLLPSSVLGNFYLAGLDQNLRGDGRKFWRYMDDMAIAAPAFHTGRQFLDRAEIVLYRDGLSLGSGKTKVIRATSATDEFKTMRDRFDDDFKDLLDSLGDYAPDEGREIDELRRAQLRAMFDEAVAALRDRDVFRRSEFTIALQELGRAEDGHPLSEIAYVLLRIPGLTKVACSYLADVTQPEHRLALVAALEAIVLEPRFHRAHEWLHILRAVSVAGDQVAPKLLGQLAELSRSHEHPLVRCRALLAWGRQSPPDEFDVADDFVAHEKLEYLNYALVAIQGKNPERRAERYDAWSGEGRTIATLATSLRGKPLKWHAT